MIEHNKLGEHRWVRLADQDAYVCEVEGCNEWVTGMDIAMLAWRPKGEHEKQVALDSLAHPRGTMLRWFS